MQDMSASLRAQAEYFRAPQALRSRIGAQIRAQSRAAPRTAKPARSASSFSLPP